MRYSKLLSTLFLGVAAPICSAQQMAAAALSNESAPAVVASAAPAPGKLSSCKPKFDRWVDLREMNFSLRYRSVFDSNNAHEYNQGQQRGILDGKLKFDKQGKYGAVFHASTGKYFNWAYADFMGGGNSQGLALEYAKATPLQLAAIEAYLPAAEQSGGWSFYLRRLYLDAEPVSGLELQFGSLDINRGDASEITTYDNDGYISGERILIKKPQRVFFDEISLTNAYFGDLYTPNFFAAATGWAKATTTRSCCARESRSASTRPSTTPGRTRRTPIGKTPISRFPRARSWTASAPNSTSARTLSPFGTWMISLPAARGSRSPATRS
jgi:hypothetical protein